MSQSGCLIVGSDTEPVREVIRNGATGHLVNFYDRDAIASRVVQRFGEWAGRKYR